MSAAAVAKRHSQKKPKNRGMRITERKQKENASLGDGQYLQQVHGKMSPIGISEAVEHEAWTEQDGMVGDFYADEDDTYKGISFRNGQHLQQVDGPMSHDFVSGDFYPEADDVARGISISHVPNGFDDYEMGLCISMTEASADEKHPAVEQEGCATPVADDGCMTGQIIEEQDNIVAEGISLGIPTDSCGDETTLEAVPLGLDQILDVHTKEMEDLEHAVPATVLDEEIEQQDDLSTYLFAIDQGATQEVPCDYRIDHGLLTHVQTGILVHSPAMRMAPATDQAILLYHYTHKGMASAFSASTDFKTSIRASFGDRAHYGDGIYATSRSPAQFGSKEEWREEGVTDYCVPIIVPRSVAGSAADCENPLKHVQFTLQEFLKLLDHSEVYQVDIGQSLSEGSSESNPGRTENLRTVAIFADYDGCFDIVSPSNSSGRKMDKMFDYAEEIGRLIHPRQYAEKLLLDFVKEVTDGVDRVVLFSGSNRQSRKADEFNAIQNDNGLAMTGLRQLAQEHGWEWNTNLLEDVGKKPSDIMSTVGGSSKIKQLLAENNFTCLTGPTTVYFFDDVEKYLKYTRDQATVPENIELKTVWFDWYGICIDGIQDGPLIPVSVQS